jgi:hypothetical protein
VKSYTLGILRGMIRKRFELGDDTHQYWTTALLHELINASRDALRDIAAESDPERHVSRVDVTIVSGTDAYDLSGKSPPFWKDLAVWVEYSQADSGWIQMPRAEIDRIHRLGKASSDVRDWYYYFNGQTLYIHPEPAATPTVRVIYLGATTDLSGDSDTVTLTPQELKWLLLDIGLEVADRDDDDEAWARRYRMKGSVETNLRSRPQINQAGPHRGSNVYA